VPKSVRLWMTPLGMSFFFSLPASFGIEVVEEGMLKTT
jgi:hypothetical protein